MSSSKKTLQNNESLWSREQKTLNELNSEALYSHYLRHYRGQGSLASNITSVSNTSGNFELTLEKIRNLIFQNKTESIESLINSAEPKNEIERCELDLEKLRYFMSVKNYPEALNLSGLLIQNQNLVQVSLLTCLQIRGDLYLRLNSPEQAKEQLLNAFDLIQLHPNQRSAHSTIGFLVIAELQLNNIESAQYYLNILKHHVLKISQIELKADRSLIYLRTQAHLLKNLNLHSELKRCLQKCKELAFWLSEMAVYTKCIDELKSVDEKSAGQESHLFKNWILVEDMDLLLTFNPKQVLAIDKSPLTKNVLLALENGPLEIELFFEKVWGLKFNEQLHNQHLRSTLSNLRKNLPDLQIKTKDRKISIE